MTSVELVKQIQLLITRFGSGYMGSAAWLALSAAASRGVVVVSGFVISRSFGVEIFALYSFLIATVAIATVFSNFGLGLAATKVLSDSNSITSNLSGFVGTSRIFVIFVSLIFAALFSFNLDYFAGNLAGSNNEVAAYYILISIITNTLVSMETSILIGRKEFKLIGLIGIFAGGMNLGLTLFFSFRNEFTFVLMSAIFTSFLSYILLYCFANKSLYKAGIFPSVQIDTHFLLAIKRYALPLFLSSVFYAPTIWLATSLVINSPDGPVSIGHFYAADNLRGVLIFFSAMIAQASLPYLSEYSNVEHSERFEQLVGRILILVVGFTLFMVFVLFALTPHILNLYGSDYHDASGVMLIVLFSAIFVSISNVLGQVLLAKHKTWEGFVFNFIWSVCLITASALLCFTNLSSIAMPIGLLLSYILITIVQFRFVVVNLRVRIFFLAPKR